MRAAILDAAGADPRVGEFQDPPAARKDQLQVDVSAAGVNPVDLHLASGRMGKPTVPSVVGREGVGTLADGRRVYFNPSISPFGSWAERTLVAAGRTFPVPDALDDGLAVALGIAGLAAWLPLEHHARLAPGESVLVLGASGVVGQVAVQVARIMQAGRIVAAARSADALVSVRELGADDTATLGQGDDAQALRAVAGDGFDVVIDPIYGSPFQAALEATAVGARLVTIGGSAGGSVEVSFRALQGRTHIGHNTGVISIETRRDAYAKLTAHAAAGRIRLEIERYSLDQAQQAWQAQAESPHRKLVVVP